MKIEDIISVIDGVVTDFKKGKIHHIEIDSRKVGKKDVFIAIHNGVNYIEEALKKGSYCIGEKNLNLPNYIQVRNSIEALGKIGHFIRQQYPIPLIAITGSCGKTTTKELIYAVLSQKYHVLKNEKNYNNHIGLPLTLTKIKPYHEIVVTELGMNHLGEISYLSKLCNPDYAVITNIGSSHIGLLGSKKNIFKAKMEILEGMHPGVLYVNGDDNYLKKVSSSKISLKSVQNLIERKDKLEFDMKIEEKYYHFIFPIPGKHLLPDILFAISFGLQFSVPIEKIQYALSHFHTEKGRMHLIKGKYTIIDDCYNASYEALKGSLQCLTPHAIIILGDMLELGKYSKYYHKKVNAILKKIKPKKVLLIGKYTKYIHGIHFSSLSSLYTYLNTILEEDDVIFIKGSHRFHLEEIVLKLEENNKTK